MSLRVAFDMDGVLSDFSGAYHEIEARLFGGKTEPSPPQDEDGGPVSTADAAISEGIKRERRRRAAVWDVIRTTDNFWIGLRPIEPHAVRRLKTLAIEHRWEVFFITQRPSTIGDTVQRQTQRWLCEQGFDLPSVLVLPGSRGPAAATLSLNYYVDDSATNCVDLTADSHARSILILDDADATARATARRLGIATARSIGVALDILQSASAAQSRPDVLGNLVRLVGWKQKT